MIERPEEGSGLGRPADHRLDGPILLLFVQEVGIIGPMFLFSSEAVTQVSYASTLKGQCSIKNQVLTTARLVIGAAVRGGQLSAKPQPVRSPEKEYARQKESLKEQRARLL